MLNISGLNTINGYNRIYGGKSVNGVTIPDEKPSVDTKAQPYYPLMSAPLNLHPVFKGSQIRTSLEGKQEQEKYNTVASMLDKKVKKDLNELLKTGKLLDTSSNDKTTTLDNLYNIATKPRVIGLDTTNILSEVITTIKHPFNITQKFGDIPANLQNEIINQERMQGKDVSALDLDVKSSTCPAASIEFNLAHKMPSEFARMAENLTSDKMCINKKINVKDLSQGLMDTIWMLNEFGTEHKLENWDTLNVVLRPDRNAIIRARIQNTYKDPDEHSVVDILMQSTFMNVGAQNSYDSLIDKRIPKYNEDDSGLIDIEKNFAEELATGKGKVCVTYQRIDDNGKLAGYECEQAETLSHIQNTLNQGDNVIIGYTYCDSDNNVISGHEITIIGIETDKRGNKYFVCNDTDDGVSEAIKYPVEELLPKIHHAGIPKSVLEGNVEFVEGWKELLQIYKDTKQQTEVQNAINRPLYVLNQAA